VSVDLVLHGGVVVTGQPGAPRARAVAVHDGYVVALDSDALDLLPIARATLDLQGGAVLPSFGDGHVHPLWGGVEMAGPAVRDATSVADVVEAVRRWAADHPDAHWVEGGPYDPTLAPGGRFDARWLDAAVADRPVVLQSTDHHCIWVNTEALRRAGIDETTPDPPTGEVARRPDGRPLGTLVEWQAMDLVLRHAPKPTPEQRRDGLARASRLLAAAGVTWVQEAALAPADVPVYLDTAAAGRLALRANVALRAEPDRWREQRGEFLAARHDAGRLSASGDVSVRTVKIFADGVVEAGTAAMLEPYADALGDAPGHRGNPVWAADELAAAAVAFDADGFQLHVHAIGDAAVRDTLDALDRVRQVNGPRDRRPVIAHTQCVDPDDVPRFAALGVIANLEPLWAQLDPLQVDLTLPRLGAERGARQYPMASLLATGAVLSMGSDWPVSSHRPLEGLAVAATRQTAEGRPPGGWVPAERLPVAAALAAYSQGVAYQAFEEHLWGTVAVGRRADLVWLDGDPTAVDPGAWADLAVRGTWLAGRRTHGDSSNDKDDAG
jgi:predicted amidohydrolase YtcJ